MLEKIQQYLDTEYNKVVDYFEYQYEWAENHPKTIFTNARTRACTVIMFAQEFLDVKYEDVLPIYEEYIKKIYKFQKKCLTNKTINAIINI